MIKDISSHHSAIQRRSPWLKGFLARVPASYLVVFRAGQVLGIPDGCGTLSPPRGFLADF